IILPVYNGEKYLENLISKIRNQEINYEIEIISAVSKSDDKSLELSKMLCDITFEVGDFNHAKTRHEAVEKSTGGILVFLTQDVTPYNKYWLNNLIQPLIENNEIVATYAKQIAYPNSTETEKLIREFNYPDYDRLCNKNTKGKWGRKNIYYSDACSATIKEVFIKLGGYNFDVVTNEDVIYALNVINNGYSIFYNSKSKVYHSHNFEIKNAYNRYRLIGIFEKEYNDQLSEYSSLGEGKKLLFYLVKNLLRKLKIKDLFLLSVDLVTRYIAYKKGYSEGSRINTKSLGERL
ncbi:MAG: glycosyltransferase, partial [Bacillus sp. (in: firmicutes)]